MATMGRLKTLLEKFSMALGVQAVTSKGRDYRALSSYLLKITRLRDIDRVLFEASRCLRELLDCELSAFALRKGRSLDVWVDPRFHDDNIVDTVKRTFTVRILTLKSTVSPKARPGRQPSPVLPGICFHIRCLMKGSTSSSVP